MYNEYEESYDWYSDFDDFDESLNDIDFSEVAGKKGDFKKSFKNANRKIEQKNTQKVQSKQQPKTGRQIIRRPINNTTQQRTLVQRKPTEQGRVIAPKTTKEQGLPKRKIVQGSKPKAPQQQIRRINTQVNKGARIDRFEKKISKILIPDDKKVIVEGVSKFILSQKPDDLSIKNIGYYKGQKLRELVLIFNNITPNPFTIELFNPSAPLDYLYNTSQNLNNKIEVNGNNVAYSDVLFNLLANPTLIPNCKFTFSGVNLNAQKAIPLSVIDRDINGEEFIMPLNIDLTIDNLQVQSDVTFFDITEKLNRPYIPDGMDTIKYTVLPNMSVIMAFFYYQKSIKKAFFEEARIENPMKDM